MNLFLLICMLILTTGTVVLGIYSIVACDFTAGGIFLIMMAVILIAALVYAYPSSKVILERQNLLQFSNKSYVVQENTKDGLEYTFLYSDNGDITVLKSKYSKIQFIFDEAQIAPFVEVMYHPCMFRDVPAEEPQYIIHLKNSYQISELIY